MSIRLSVCPSIRLVCLSEICHKTPICFGVIIFIAAATAAVPVSMCLCAFLERHLRSQSAKQVNSTIIIVIITTQVGISCSMETCHRLIGVVRKSVMYIYGYVSQVGLSTYVSLYKQPTSLSTSSSSAFSGVAIISLLYGFVFLSVFLVWNGWLVGWLHVRNLQTQSCYKGNSKSNKM